MTASKQIGAISVSVSEFSYYGTGYLKSEKQNLLSNSAGKEVTYGYDAAGTYPDSDTEGFGMDDLGNRDGNQILRQDGTVHFTPDPLTNRFTAVAGHPLAYDDAGNLTQN